MLSDAPRLARELPLRALRLELEPVSVADAL
jgi:hypothetical protein